MKAHVVNFGDRPRHGLELKAHGRTDGARPLPTAFCRWLSVALALLAFTSKAQSQTVLFFDDFNGPTLNSAFQPSLPLAGQGNLSNDVSYLGAPNYAFQDLNGTSVLRLTNTLNNRQRVGWSTSTVFTVPDFRLEIRFNTLTQSPTTSIDSFIEGWILDANAPTRWDMAEPNGANFSSNRLFNAASSIDPSALSTVLGYQDDTWYRLVIQGSAGDNVRASIFPDYGFTELAGYSFGHTASAFSSGFRLGLSQAMGAPGHPSPVDVAIDYILLTTTAVPEPSSLLLVAAAAGTIFGIGRRKWFATRRPSEPEASATLPQ